jgi:hypothetical protein
MGEELLGIIPAKKPLHAIERLKAEQVLSEKFGDQGVKVYIKVDGKKNAEEIRAELAIPEAQFLEIIAFLEDRGMVETRTVFEAEFEGKGADGAPGGSG